MVTQNSLAAHSVVGQLYIQIVDSERLYSSTLEHRLESSRYNIRHKGLKQHNVIQRYNLALQGQRSTSPQHSWWYKRMRQLMCLSLSLLTGLAQILLLRRPSDSSGWSRVGRMMPALDWTLTFLLMRVAQLGRTQDPVVWPLHPARRLQYFTSSSNMTRYWKQMNPSICYCSHRFDVLHMEWRSPFWSQLHVSYYAFLIWLLGLANSFSLSLFTHSCSCCIC